MQDVGDEGALCTALSDSGSLDWERAEAVAVSRGIGEVHDFKIIRIADGAELQAHSTSDLEIWRVGSSAFFIKEVGGKVLAVRSSATSEAFSVLNAAVQFKAKRGANEFSQKTDEASAEGYFHYYGMLQHQQNMLQDFIRTGTYYAAITENKADFEGKVVMDVGAGSGILSLFAAQAGAAKVYAVEASDMATHAAQLALANPGFGERVQVVKGRLEELAFNPTVDVLISEPMGTLLVNERMLETYLYARKNFLKPGGKMFPSVGRIHVAAFSDHILYGELVSKAAFWLQGNFYGVSVASLHGAAITGYFTQVVVDAIPPEVLVSRCATKLFDFERMDDDDLEDIVVPLDLPISATCQVHGVATWFDVLFNGTTTQRWLSTAPGQPTTHWKESSVFCSSGTNGVTLMLGGRFAVRISHSSARFQLRCVLEKPISVTAGESITGELRLKAHQRQSYDIFLTLIGPPLAPGHPPQRASGRLALKDPYFRQLNTPMPEAPAEPVGVVQ